MEVDGDGGGVPSSSSCGVGGSADTCIGLDTVTMIDDRLHIFLDKISHTRYQLTDTITQETVFLDGSGWTLREYPDDLAVELVQVGDDGAASDAQQVLFIPVYFFLVSCLCVPMCEKHVCSLCTCHSVRSCNESFFFHNYGVS